MKIDVTRNAGDTTITQKFYDDGSQVDPGTVTVTATRADGTVLDSGSSAAKTGTGGTAEFGYTLLAAWLATLDLIAITWTRTDTGGIVTDRVEIVGGQLFTINDMRTFDDGAFADTTDFTNDDIADVRRDVTDYLEQATGQSWIPRFADLTLSGDGSDEIRVPHHHISTVLAAWIADTALTAAELADLTIDGRCIVRDSSYWTSGRRNVRIQYEYGRPYLDNGVSHIATLLAADRLQAANVEYETESVSDDGVTVSYAEEIPKVKRWIRDNTWKPRSDSAVIR